VSAASFKQGSDTTGFALRYYYHQCSRLQLVEASVILCHIFTGELCLEVEFSALD